MLCVAMMGMHFGCLERLKNFSSPVGSFSPTVAKCWYSSQRKRTWRKCRLGMGFNLRDAIQNSALKIEFHHHADGFGESRVHGDREVQGTDRAHFRSASETTVAACRSDKSALAFGS